MFRYELHMHTREASACAWGNIHEMIRTYVDLGFAGAVVTNHFIGGNTCIDRSLPWKEFVEDYSRCYYEGQNTAQKLDFDLLFGIEQGYGNGKEFLAYGLEPEQLAANPQLRTGSAKDWADAVHATGGFFAYAHPFRDRSYITDPRRVPDMSIADGVEVYNRGDKPEDTAEAERVFPAGSTVIIAGTDSHRIELSGAYGVVLPHRVKTGKELAAALKANNFTLWLG